MRYFCTECESIIEEDDVIKGNEVFNVAIGRVTIPSYAICPLCGSELKIHEGEDGEVYVNEFKDFECMFDARRRDD